jgi:hypothetical protein
MDLDYQLATVYTFAATRALYDVGIFTLHLWGEPVDVIHGPSVVTLALSLQDQTQENIRKAQTTAKAMESLASRAIGLPPGAELPVRVTHKGGYLLAEFPQVEPYRPTFPELEEFAGELVLLGLDQYNRPAHVDLSGAHAFVAGTTGSGKTNVLRLVAAQCLSKGWTVSFADAKGDLNDWSDLLPFSPWPLAVTENEMLGLLDELEAIIRDRYANRHAPRDPLLLVFDEVLDTGNPVKTRLITLAQQGRAAGLRCIMGAHRIGKELPPALRVNITTRIVGKVPDDTESRLATGMEGLGAETLTGAGDMLLVAQGEVKRVQVARAAPEDIAHLLAPLDRPEPATVVASSPAKPLNSIDAVMRELDRRADAAGAEAPPVWLIARGVAHMQRTGRLPTFAQLDSWAKQETGAGLSMRKKRETRWAIEILVEPDPEVEEP